MAITYKILGQVLSTANNTSNVYSVPIATSTVVSTITVCNQSANAATFKLSVRPTSEALDAKHYINYDTPIPGNDTITLTLGFTLSANDVVESNSSTSTVSYSAFGSEIT